MKISNPTIVLFVLVMLLGALLKISVNRFYAERKEKERIYEAFKANNDDVLSYIKTLDDKLAAQGRVIELRSSELRELYPSIAKEIQNLKLKLNKLQSVSTTSYASQKQITTLIKDSTIHDTLTTRVFDYRDSYYHIKGIAVKDTQHVHIELKDTLVQVVYKGKRKHPWLWIFSKRQLEQRVALKNPHAKIEYSKVIKVHK